ncbi:hypothetical protein CsSME_00011539 [Camellia sinensis var. sinensis]
MASSATPCTLMLSHGASSLLPQPLTPSLSFKPKPCFFNFSNTFSLYPLVLQNPTIGLMFLHPIPQLLWPLWLLK